MKRFALFCIFPLLVPVSTEAAITMVAGTSGGPHLFLGNIGTGGSKWNTVPAGANANVYWDADKNGVFGETAKGENSGNSTATLGFTINIADAVLYHFAVEGFSNPGTNIGMDFDIHNTDSSIQRVQVLAGGTTPFSDSNGDEWEASFVFTLNAYGNVVDNVTHTGGGDGTTDHQGVLTFTQVPEPSVGLMCASLLGFGLLRWSRR